MHRGDFLHTIVISDCHNKSIGQKLFELISRFSSIAFVGERIIVPKSPEFLLIDASVVSKIEASDIILIMSGGRLPNVRYNQIHCAVSGGDDVRALSALQKVKLPLVTCGMSPRDTLSLSARNEQSFSFSLQREVVTVFDEKIEPCELIVKNTADFPLQTVAFFTAIMLLTGYDGEFS